MTTWLASLHFLRPHALWLLLLAPLLVWGWRFRQRRSNVWRQVVDPHLLPHLLAGTGRAGWGALTLLLFGYALAVLALAGPSTRQGEQPLWEQRAPLVIALDLSSATQAADLPPSRLLQARGKLATLLRQRQGGQVALVAFAGDAFTVAPLTEDAGNVALFLDALTPEVMPADGQRMDRAITWSTKLLKQAGFREGGILLISDHADASALEAASQAAQQGYRVSVLGLGSPAGTAYRARDGSLGRARLDAASLGQLATRGGGRFQPLSRDDSDLEALGVLTPDSLDAARASGGRGRDWLDEGYWLLPPLMLLALFAFRRGAVLIVFGACSLLWAMPSQAADGGWWRRADQQQHARMEQGVQAYRNGDFAAAEQAFAGQDSAEAQYNLGNALARQGKYDQAIDAYDRALGKQPGMPDAVANRGAVERARQRQQGQGQSGKDSSGRGAGNAGSSPNASRAASNAKPASPSSTPDSQPAPSSEPAQSQSAARPSQPQPRTAEPSSDSAADPKAQQAADAAQRERMRQALARQSRGQDGKPVAGQAAADETPEQRERRQALQAWLKRVPDDPGGLLKAKFQLEHERRMREGQ